MSRQGRIDYEIDDKDSAANANMESDIGNAAFRAHEAPRLAAPCRIHFHHTRKRLADLDGLSVKAAIDGLVHAGILADDSAKQITSITHSQSKGDPEETIITIETGA